MNFCFSELPEFRDFKVKTLGSIFAYQSHSSQKMLLIVFDHLGIRQLFAIIMPPGFPDISMTSGTFLISGPFLRLLESLGVKMSLITFD